MLNRQFVCGGLACLAALSASAQAAVITPSLTPTSLGATAVPPPGAAGYVFYSTHPAPAVINVNNAGQGTDISANGNVAAPTNYVSIDTSGDSFYGNADYSVLSINGSSEFTGLAFQAPGAGNTVTLATLTLTDTNGSTTDSAIIAPFTLGLLLDNGGITNAAPLTVASGVSSVTITPAPTGTANDFYFVNVLGGVAGQIITISGTQAGTGPGSNAVTLGGLTFDAVVSPEPASLGLLAVGGLLMLRRRAKA